MILIVFKGKMLNSLQTYFYMYATIVLAELDQITTLPTPRLDDLEKRLKAVETDHYSDYGNKPKHGFKRRV